MPCTDRGRNRVHNPDILALEQLRKKFKEQGISITNITKRGNSMVFIIIRGCHSNSSLLLSKDKSKGCLVIKVLDNGI